MRDSKLDWAVRVPALAALLSCACGGGGGRSPGPLVPPATAGGGGSGGFSTGGTPGSGPGAASGAGSAAPAYVVASRATLTSPRSLGDAEEHIAVDPSDPANLVAVVTHIDASGNSFTRYASSLSVNGGGGGAVWREGDLPRDAQTGKFPTADGRAWDATGDPVVAIDRAGNVYMANLYVDMASFEDGLYVSVASLPRSPGPLTFAAAATRPVAPPAQPGVFEDKEWIAVDNGARSPFQGNVYVAWSRLDGAGERIFFARSLDRGRTWSAAVPLSGGFDEVTGSQIATGPGGEVYVVYLSHRSGPQQESRIMIARSFDGGASFGAAAPVTAFFEEVSVPAAFRTTSLPAAAANPASGELYVVWADRRGFGGAEVELVRSTDRGASFFAPALVNDLPAGEQFMPAAAVDESGTLHVSWFDTRDGGGAADRYDIYAARSTDGGRSFSRSARVTAATIDAGAASFIGDYAGIAAAGGSAHPVWTSGGDAGGRLEAAALR